MARGDGDHNDDDDDRATVGRRIGAARRGATRAALAAGAGEVRDDEGAVRVARELTATERVTATEQASIVGEGGQRGTKNYFNCERALSNHHIMGFLSEGDTLSWEVRCENVCDELAGGVHTHRAAWRE